MSKNEKEHIVIDKSNEARKPGISKMIDEGGLGADKYYDIKKEQQSKENKKSSDLDQQ